MTESRRLKEIAVLIYLLIIPLVLYFKYFPTIINSLTTNALFLALLSTLVALLVYGSFLIKKSLDVYLLLPQTLLIAFVVRAIPSLRYSATVLSDSYFHYATTLNVLDYGVANPRLDWWYGNIQQQLPWPLMHLLTATSTLISGVDLGLLFRFQEPFLGVLFVLAAFIVAKLVLKNDGMALLSAVVALSSAEVIFFQSEYHPQGLAFVYFVFLAFVFLKQRETRNRSLYGAFFIFLAALVFAHHFSALFIGLFAVVMSVMYFVVMQVPRVRPEFTGLLKKLSGDYRIWLLIAVPALVYQLWRSTNFAQSVLSSALALGRSAEGSPYPVPPPVLYTILNSSKYILLLLAAVSLILTVRTQSVSRVRAAILAGGFIIVGFVGYSLGGLPIPRSIGFYAAFGALFVALTVYSIKDQWFPSLNKSFKTGFVIALICVPIVAGVLGSQLTPAYLLKESGVDAFYLNSNDLSSFNREKTTGTWLFQHVPRNATVAYEFDTLPAAFYYGRYSFFYYRESIAQDKNQSDYIVVNPDLPYSSYDGSSVLYSNFNKTAYLNTVNVIYDDGELKTGGRYR